MYKYGRNTYIKALREIGVSDSERKEMRQLARELQEKDIYSKVDKINQQLLGESVRPVSLSYENALRTMQYTGKSFGEILEDYRQEIRNVEQGTTNEANYIYDKYVSELADFGIYTNRETLANINNQDKGAFKDIQDNLEFLIMYREVILAGAQGNVLQRAIDKAINQIIKIIERYAV